MHAVQLKPTIKVKISRRMASIGVSDVVSASVYSEKTRMKKLMMMKMIIIIIIISTRNVLLSAQMGERASVVLICIVTSCYNEVK